MIGLLALAAAASDPDLSFKAMREVEAQAEIICPAAAAKEIAFYYRYVADEAKRLHYAFNQKASLQMFCDMHCRGIGEGLHEAAQIISR